MVHHSSDEKEQIGAAKSALDVQPEAGRRAAVWGSAISKQNSASKVQGQELRGQG